MKEAISTSNARTTKPSAKALRGVRATATTECWSARELLGAPASKSLNQVETVRLSPWTCSVHGDAATLDTPEIRPRILEGMGDTARDVNDGQGIGAS